MMSKLPHLGARRVVLHLDRAQILEVQRQNERTRQRKVTGLVRGPTLVLSTAVLYCTFGDVAVGVAKVVDTKGEGGKKGGKEKEKEEGEGGKKERGPKMDPWVCQMVSWSVGQRMHGRTLTL